MESVFVHLTERNCEGMGGTGGALRAENLSPLLRLRLRSRGDTGEEMIGESHVGAIKIESLCAAGNDMGWEGGLSERILENSRVYHSESESSESDSSERSTTGNVDGLCVLLITRGLIEARRGLKVGKGSWNSSSDDDGVKGKHAFCESGLDGNDEDIEGGDLHGDRESDDGVGRGGSGKLKDKLVNVTTSSAMSSRAVLSSVGDTLSARRRCALVVDVDVLRDIGAMGVESDSSSGIISSRLPVEMLGILVGTGLVPFLRVRLSLACRRRIASREKTKSTKELRLTSIPGTKTETSTASLTS